MFTVSLKPYRDESLTGYLTRFAYENGLTILTLWNELKGSDVSNPQRSDYFLVDTLPDTVLNIQYISKVFCISQEEIFACTLSNVLATFSHSQKLGHARFIKGMIRKQVYYCPACLLEAEYHKLSWRINGIDCCVKHQNKLRDDCGHCGLIIIIGDLVHINVCPRCGETLSSAPSIIYSDIGSMTQQDWYIQSWETLIKMKRDIRPDEVALRVLYILNGLNDHFDRNRVAAASKTLGFRIEELLQLARDTSTQRRMIHLLPLLRLLYNNNFDIISFFNLSVPHGFVELVTSAHNSKADHAKCLSPWCPSFEDGKSLVRTGMSTKHYKDGRVLSYHLACLDCGCEYAYDRSGQQQTKSLFLNAYEAIGKLDVAEITIAKLSKSMGISIAKSRRVMAYFQNRGIVESISSIDDKLVNLFVRMICNNTRIIDIEKLNCWKDVNHYLLHRYHPLVMKELILHKRPAGERVTKNSIFQAMVTHCEGYLKIDQDITLGNIAEAVGISPNTIRKWGYHVYILNMKEKQYELRRDKAKANLLKRVIEYFDDHKGNQVLAKEVYSYLGIKQSYLCQYAPEVNDYIRKHRLEYNAQYTRGIVG